MRIKSDEKGRPVVKIDTEIYINPISKDINRRSIIQWEDNNGTIFTSQYFESELNALVYLIFLQLNELTNIIEFIPL